jgi:hypothetical protein
MPILKNPSGQNPLALAGRIKAARTFTPYKMDSRGQYFRTRCRTRQPRRYNMAGLWRKSPRPCVHMIRYLCIVIGVFHGTGMLRIALSCTAGKPFEHDPEKWTPVFPRDKRKVLARRSCSKQEDFAVLTRSKASIECLSRAAPKRRHVLFSQDRLCRVRTNARYVAGL